MPKQVQWFGSKKCDICGIECENDLYDAPTVQGSWATMCQKCYQNWCKYPFRFGLGLGQHYVKNENGNFVKKEG